MPLEKYHEKRDFTRTPEPAGDGDAGTTHGAALPRFVIQKHHARPGYDVTAEEPLSVLSGRDVDNVD